MGRNEWFKVREQEATDLRLLVVGFAKFIKGDITDGSVFDGRRDGRSAVGRTESSRGEAPAAVHGLELVARLAGQLG